MGHIDSNKAIESIGGKGTPVVLDCRTPILAPLRMTSDDLSTNASGPLNPH